MESIDLIVENIGKLVTPLGQTPLRGRSMRNMTVLQNQAVGIHDGRIQWVKSNADVDHSESAAERIDAEGKAVVPGFVDCHTHAVWSGSRTAEFEMRMAGSEYLEILEAGGGILSTVQAVREATLDELVDDAHQRLLNMMNLGTTTAEIKSGYGLTVSDELKMLQAVEKLNERMPMDLVPTFLGAHAIPPEYSGKEGSYVDYVVDDMIPEVTGWLSESSFSQVFIDVFCEQAAFDAAQSRRILEAGKKHGMGVKIHTDEFTSIGGVDLAVDLQAVSADHLDVTEEDGFAKLAASNTVGVLMPAVNVHLGSTHFANGQAMIDAECLVALATDINPGSAPCPSMPLIMALACRYNGLTMKEALVGATLNAAAAIGLSRHIGSVEVGKQADILILDTTDWRDLIGSFGSNLVGTVIKAGVAQ